MASRSFADTVSGPALRVCVVSSCGGHLAEVRAIVAAYSQYEHFYVLNDRIELPHDMLERTTFIAHAERNWLVLLNLFEAWRILRRNKPDVILSTGAGPVVPFALVGKVLGIPTVFIETVARISSPSLTGRIMYVLADRFFYQWPSLRSYFPKGQYCGSVL